MPSSPSDSGKTVSDAESRPATPLPPTPTWATQTAQLAEGDDRRHPGGRQGPLYGDDAVSGQTAGTGGDKA